MTPNQTNHIMLVYNMYEKEPQRSRLTKRGKFAIVILLVLSGISSMAQTRKKLDTIPIYSSPIDLGYFNRVEYFKTTNFAWFEMRALPTWDRPDSLLINVSKSQIHWINDSTAIIRRK